MKTIKGELEEIKLRINGATGLICRAEVQITKELKKAVKQMEKLEEAIGEGEFNGENDDRV